MRFTAPLKTTGIYNESLFFFCYCFSTSNALRSMYFICCVHQLTFARHIVSACFLFHWPETASTCDIVLSFPSPTRFSSWRNQSVRPTSGTWTPCHFQCSDHRGCHQPLLSVLIIPLTGTKCPNMLYAFTVYTLVSCRASRPYFILVFTVASFQHFRVTHQ